MNTPTPGDLSARLREVLSFYANKANYDSPESNCGNYYLASEADKDKGEKAREAIAALSALPAAGGAKPRPVAWYVFAGTEHWVTHDEDEAEGNRAGGCEVRPLIFGDTPQPSAAEDAAVGAQGEGVDDTAALLVKWRTEAATGRKAADRPGISTEASITMHAIVDSMLQLADELEAALTRQPVAGDGMVLVPREPSPEQVRAGTLTGILTPNQASAAYQAMLAAAPAATPTDGGEGE